MSGNLIPDEMAQRTGRLINEAENVRAQAVDDLKTIYADLREELKSLGWRGAEVSEQVAAFKAAISEMRLDDEKKAKREAKGDLVSEYINVLTVSRARARVRADKGVEVGVDTPHDPETGEILESGSHVPAASSSRLTDAAPDESSVANHAGPQFPAVPGGDPSIPSPDADDGAKMDDDCSRDPGQPGDEPECHYVQSGQAANNSEPDAAMLRPEPAVNPAGHIDTPATGQTSAQTDGDAIGGVKVQGRLPDAAGVEPSPSEPIRKSSLKPLCRYPGKDRCAGYGSVTCHACLRAAREDEVAA